MSIYHILEKINSDARMVGYSKWRSWVFTILLVFLMLGQVGIYVFLYGK